jgi:hypothetical protein
MEKDDNILLELNQFELIYFKTFLKTINPECNIEQLMKSFMHSNNFSIVQKIKTLFWRPRNKIHFDVNYIEINNFDENYLLSPNYTISFKNNYLKYIASINPKISISEKAFFEFYITEIERCIYIPHKLRENNFIIEHGKQIYNALKTWNDITNNKENKNRLDDLNWNIEYFGEKWLFGIPISEKNSKNFNEFMLNAWIFFEAHKND